MDIIGIIILAVIGNKLIKSNKNNTSARTSRVNPSSDYDLEREAKRQQRLEDRSRRETRTTHYTERVETLSEEAIYACIQLVQEYSTMAQMQRSQLESKMNEQVKAQFYHMFNCLWQMTEIQQLEYLTQQSRNGLYGQIGTFAIRYFRR